MEEKSVGMAQIGSVWLRTGTCRAFVKAVTNLPVPYNARNVLTSWGTISFSRKKHCSLELMLNWHCMWVDVLTTETQKIAIVWGVTPCGLVCRYHSHRGICSVQWQAWGRWEQRIPLKRVCLCTKLHSDMPHKRVFSRNWLWEWGISVAIPNPGKRRTSPINLLKPNDIHICRTAALTSRSYILNIYSTNIHTEYFKHAA